MKKLFLAVMLVAGGLNLMAQDGTEAEFRKWALTPPMGWNSWDCYYSTVNEKITMANARAQKRKLLKYGYDYVVVDIRWYADHPSNGGGWYNQTNPDCRLDEYGRYIPSPTRFPKGLKWMADSIHRMGMKFGIHIMRGLPKYILDNPSAYKLKGAEDVSWDKVYTSTTPECTWLQDNLTIRNNKYGQLYYNSIVDLYAEWGVDFIKVDDISRPYATEEINMLRKAIDQCGRPIVLSLSPGKTAYDKVDDLHQKANMWRMMDDLWDKWSNVKDVFAEAAHWAEHHQPGCYADCDMLPLGQISMTVGDEGYCNADGGRRTNLTEDEQYTMMTLWGICHSPLFFGGDVTMMDNKTLRLLTNEDYLNMHAYGVEARQILNEKGRIQWTSLDPATGDRYLALFYTDAGNGWIFDDQALFASETCAYTTQGHKVDVDVALPKGTRTLALVVDDAGDGFSYDHGDWVNPTLIMEDGSKRALTGDMMKEKYTNSFYNVVRENTNVLGTGKMSVMGKTYDRGFSTDANALMIFELPEGVARFTAIAALDDSGVGQSGATTSIKFYVFDRDPRLTEDNAVQEADHTVDLVGLGYEKGQKVTAYDVWNDGARIGTFADSECTQTVNRHGAKLLRLVAERSGSNTLALQTASDGVGSYLVTATVDGSVDDHSYVKFYMDDEFVGTVKVEPGTNSVAYHTRKLPEGRHTFKAQYSGTVTTPACGAEPVSIEVGTSVSQIGASEDGMLDVKVGNGGVEIKTVPYANVRIYRTSGVMDSTVVADSYGRATAMLDRGIYIVNANRSSSTVMIK